MKKSLTKDKLLAEGKNLFDVGKYKDAIKFYTQALAIAPKFSEAYNQRGIAYSYLNDYEQAIYNFSRAIKFAPDDPDFYNNRGLCFTSTENFSLAIADYTRAINLKPQREEYYVRACW